MPMATTIEVTHMRRLIMEPDLEELHPLYVYMDSIRLVRFHLSNGTELVVGNEGYSIDIGDGHLQVTWFRPFSIDETGIFMDYTISTMPESELKEYFSGATVEFILSDKAPEDLKFGDIKFYFEGNERRTL